MKLEISLFRFDYKSDYLPYYTKNYIKIKNEKTLLDVLANINAEYPFEYRNIENFLLVVNGKYTTASVKIDSLVEKFGTDLIVEPISIRRAHTDLLINEADFQERLKVLSEFIEEEDKKTYESYKLYFYASDTLSYEYDYIGDAILLLAYDLIQKDKSKENEILEALKQYDVGASYHTSLKNKLFDFDDSIEEKISYIREKLEVSKPIKEQNLFIDNKNSINFGDFSENYSIKHNFEDFRIAYYSGKEKDLQTQELINKLNVKQINTKSMKSDLALETLHKNPNFSLRLASTIMLDAFDNAADLLVVDNEDIFYFLDSNRKSIAKVSGRDILTPVIHKNELQKLASGEHDELSAQLKKHVVDPEII